MININKEKTLFSIIVPAYNSSSFIEKCIESVLGQTCSEFELVLVDDGSNDETLSICKAYSEVDCRVKVIHKENGGHTSARNAGLLAAVGEYILFLDSDDWLAVNVLEICKSDIAKNNCPDIIVYQICNTLIEETLKNNIPDGYYQRNKNYDKIIESLLIDKNGSYAVAKSLSGKVFKKSVINENQLSVPQEVRIAEDAAAFVSAVLDSESIVINSNAKYYCLIRESSVSHSSDKDAFKRLPYLLAYYKRKLQTCSYDISEQYKRYIVAQIYTAVLLVIRSGESTDVINEGLDMLLTDQEVSSAVFNAKFSLKGYKYIIKKIVIRYRLWKIAKLLDRR